MLFSSPIFVFGFLPIVLLAYLVSPRALRNPLALAASLFFYAWGAPTFVFVVLLACVFDWQVVRWLHATDDGVARGRWVATAVGANLLLLGYFKYIDFGIASLNAGIEAFGAEPLPLLRVALPIGISFIVFEKITYIVDVYRGEGPPAARFSDYLLYIFYFPQLIAGPIIKYHDIAAQLLEREHGSAQVVMGLQRFALGLAKKVLIADSVGVVADACFGANPAYLASRDAWLGMLCYTLQIYFDFSGYSDMAIGLAHTMGFRFAENFNAPYISANFTEFWRRWHISLSSWIRDYLYVPLGGNRHGPLRTYRNLVVCFLLSGLWHGASWTFVVWGAYHGFFLVLDRLGWLRLQTYLPRAVNVLMTFLLVMLGWVVFRADTLSGALLYLQALWPRTLSYPHIVYASNATWLYLMLGLVFSFAPASNLWKRQRAKLEARGYARPFQALAALALLTLCAGQMAISGFRPFLYFRF